MEEANATVEAKGISKEEKEARERTKKASIIEGSAYSVSEGLGMRYITPYALALGANNAHIGFLSAFPTLFGNFIQLLVPKAMEKYSRKRIVFLGALFQAIMWLVVLAVGSLYFIFELNSTITPTILIVVYSLLVLFGAFISPVWSSWMKDIVTEHSGRYFGVRNRVVGFVALVSMLVGGFLLDYFKQTYVFLGFIILFSISFIARIVSAFILSKQYEPTLVCEKGYYFSLWQFLKYIPKSNFGKFAVFVALVHFATAIASPFFAVYMLKELGFSYLQWIVVSMASSLTSLLFMPVWGKFADRYGNVKVVRLTSFFIPTVPLLWFASIFVGKAYLLAYLIIVEAFSGLVWAGFNLSSSNFVYDAVTRQRMALCVAYSNVLIGVCTFIGASLGGLLASNGLMFLGLAPILVLFLISGIARFAVVLIMGAKIKEVREVEKFGIKEATEKLSTLTPSELWRHLGILQKPEQGN